MPNDVPQLCEGSCQVFWSLIVNPIYKVIFKGNNYGCLPSETRVVVSFWNPVYLYFVSCLLPSPPSSLYSLDPLSLRAFFPPVSSWREHRMPFMKGEHWLLICDRGCCASIKEGSLATEREKNVGLLLGCRSITVTSIHFYCRIL